MATHDPALMPARVIVRPTDPKYQDHNRKWQGIPNLEQSPGGKLFATFYTGATTEEAGNYVYVMTSTDKGYTWSGAEIIVEHEDPECRTFDPCLWKDPLGRIWLTYAQSRHYYDGRHGVWAIICENPDDEFPTWSEPRRIADGIMHNKPTVLKSGRWLFPIFLTASSVYQPTEDHGLSGEQLAYAYASDDCGKTFKRLGGVDVPQRSFDEHAIVELKDGTLWMLVRTTYGIGESFSHDGGLTWTPGQDSNLGGPCSRFFITRLKSGRLLLVNHHKGKGRTNLTAMVSEDEGKSWRGNLMLDNREEVSYPAGFQDDDGMIYIIYDRERHKAKEILMAVFNEEDILRGEFQSPKSRQRVLVNKATGQL